jgi:hypothetical protein
MTEKRSTSNGKANIPRQSGKGAVQTAEVDAAGAAKGGKVRHDVAPGVSDTTTESETTESVLRERDEAPRKTALSRKSQAYIRERGKGEQIPVRVEDSGYRNGYKAGYADGYKGSKRLYEPYIRKLRLQLEMAQDARPDGFWHGMFFGGMVMGIVLALIAVIWR